MQIPEEYTFTFKRLIHGLPEHLREDSRTLETLLAFFKAGGKNLAQQIVDIRRMEFEERVILARRKAVSESDMEDDVEDGTDEDLDEEDIDTDDIEDD